MEIEGLLDQVAERSAVPGHEGPIRNIILDAMPDWAADLAQFDAMGNMWVEFGPAGQATVFLAHMDEVGYEVESIDADGVVNLTRLGGVVSTAWEGQPAPDPFGWCGKHCMGGAACTLATRSIYQHRLTSPGALVTRCI